MRAGPPPRNAILLIETPRKIACEVTWRESSAPEGLVVLAIGVAGAESDVLEPLLAETHELPPLARTLLPEMDLMGEAPRQAQRSSKDFVASVMAAGLPALCGAGQLDASLVHIYFPHKFGEDPWTVPPLNFTVCHFIYDAFPLHTID